MKDNTISEKKGPYTRFEILVAENLAGIISLDYLYSSH